MRFVAANRPFFGRDFLILKSREHEKKKLLHENFVFQ